MPCLDGVLSPRRQTTEWCMTRARRCSQVWQCLGFCAADCLPFTGLRNSRGKTQTMPKMAKLGISTGSVYDTEERKRERLQKTTEAHREQSASSRCAAAAASVPLFHNRFYNLGRRSISLGWGGHGPGRGTLAVAHLHPLKLVHSIA